jgi:hypothetical protein
MKQQPKRVEVCKREMTKASLVKTIVISSSRKKKEVRKRNERERELRQKRVHTAVETRQEKTKLGTRQCAR